MPIYEYRCTQCGFRKEHLQKMNDAPLTACPSCHQPSYVKQLSAAGFQLKGSGWYATDFKGGSGSAPSRSEGSAADAGTTAAATGGGGCSGGCGCNHHH